MIRNLQSDSRPVSRGQQRRQSPLQDKYTLSEAGVQRQDKCGSYHTLTGMGNQSLMHRV